MLVAGAVGTDATSTVFETSVIRCAGCDCTRGVRRGVDVPTCLRTRGRASADAIWVAAARRCSGSNSPKTPRRVDKDGADALEPVFPLDPKRCVPSTTVAATAARQTVASAPAKAHVRRLRSGVCAAVAAVREWAMRSRPSSSAQCATPPYRLAATYRSPCPAVLNSPGVGHVLRSAQNVSSSRRMRSGVHRRCVAGSWARTYRVEGPPPTRTNRPAETSSERS